MLTLTSTVEPALTGTRSVSGDEQHVPRDAVRTVRNMSLPGQVAVATSVPSRGILTAYVLHGPASPSSTPGSEVAHIGSSRLTADATVTPIAKGTGTVAEGVGDTAGGTAGGGQRGGG